VAYFFGPPCSSFIIVLKRCVLLGRGLAYVEDCMMPCTVALNFEVVIDDSYYIRRARNGCGYFMHTCI